MIKKLICIILTVLMLASLTVAFANNGKGKGNEKGGKIKYENNIDYYNDIKEIEKQLKSIMKMINRETRLLHN